MNILLINECKELLDVYPAFFEKIHSVPSTKIIGDLCDVGDILVKLNLIDMKVMSK